MTATDELRRLLDERGVEWEDDSESIYWDGIDGTSWTAERRRAGDLRLYSIGCTPEQAIDATLGRGTCKRVYRKGGPLVYQAIEEYACSVCGNPMTDHDSYCSECGREVTAGAQDDG